MYVPVLLHVIFEQLRSRVEETEISAMSKMSNIYNSGDFLNWKDIYCHLIFRVTRCIVSFSVATNYSHAYSVRRSDNVCESNEITFSAQGEIFPRTVLN